jgi:NAD(P)-dependent dehydrogenase (short-subunit alcohol dehydrogenase family)
MRILITGSADGLGLATAESLLADGHDVVVHARNQDRAAGLGELVNRGAELVVGDFTDRAAVRRIAAELNDRDHLDAVIHNAGVWSGPAVMPVNVIAPYLLTALFKGVRRHIYLSSGLHLSGRSTLQGADWQGTKPGSYADSKLFLTTLSTAIARLRPDLVSNSVNPGWVPTKMGGPNAPDDFDLGHQTQEWLATSDHPQALTSGGYWFHHQLRPTHPAVDDHAFQNELLRTLAKETGVRLVPTPT